MLTKHPAILTTRQIHSVTRMSTVTMMSGRDRPNADCPGRPATCGPSKPNPALVSQCSLLPGGSSTAKGVG